MGCGAGGGGDAMLACNKLDREEIASIYLLICTIRVETMINMHPMHVTELHLPLTRPEGLTA